MEYNEIKRNEMKRNIMTKQTRGKNIKDTGAIQIMNAILAEVVVETK